MSELLSRKSMKLTPAQIMFNRFLTVQSGPEEKAEESVAPVVETTKATPSKALTVRCDQINHIAIQVPTRSKLICFSWLILNFQNENASKKKRIAHTLKASSSSSIVIKKPMVFPEIGSKVPTNLRQRYLDLFVEECLKLDSNKQKAYDRVRTLSNRPYQTYFKILTKYLLFCRLWAKKKEFINEAKPKTFT